MCELLALSLSPIASDDRIITCVPNVFTLCVRCQTQGRDRERDCGGMRENETRARRKSEKRSRFMIFPPPVDETIQKLSGGSGWAGTIVRCKLTFSRNPQVFNVPLLSLNGSGSSQSFLDCLDSNSIRLESRK